MVFAQEIEIAAFIGLVHVAQEHPAIAAIVMGRGFLPSLQAKREFVIRHMQGQLASGDVQFHFIAHLDRCQRSADGRFRRDVQHYSPETGAAHAGIADANHIPHAAVEQHARHGNLAPFRKSGGALRAAVLHHQHGIFGNFEPGGVNGLVHLPIILENVRFSAMLQQMRRSGGVLDDGAPRREIAAEDHRAAFIRDRISRGANHNVPLLNGEGEDLGPLGERREWVVEKGDPQSPLRGQLLEFTPTRVSVAQPHYRADAKAQRTLEIKGDTLIDTASIESTSAASQKLGLTLQLQGRVRLPDSFKPDGDFGKGRVEPFGYWKEVTGATGRDRVEFDVEYGSTVLHVTISCAGDFRIWHGNTPDSPPRRRETLYVETDGTKAVFTTTFVPKQ